MSFSRLDPQDFLISADSITSALWTNYVPTLTSNSMYTSSTQAASTAGAYYLSIYNTSSTLSTSEIQFDVVYGDKLGSGSLWYDSSISGSSPTKTIYGQYRSLVLGDENSDFIFGNYTSSQFFAISINRNRYKESLFPGSLNLILGSGSNLITLTDDSRITNSNIFKDAGRVYNLVSGSSGTVYTGVNSRGWAGGASAISGSYGWFLPDISTLILNPSALVAAVADGGIELSPNTGSNTINTNPAILYSSLKAGNSFTLNSQETITSDYIFIRARNAEFNYSENPSFISGSNGTVLYDTFINNPQTFVTTIGLYNDNNELLAVAKLSKPLKKDFTKEMLVRVKLDF
jgi:hypothetical protein